MLKTKVKASSITNLTDARYFAAWEVEWLGFDFDPHSENHLPPRSMKAIKEWVDGVKIVGEFSTASAQDVSEAIQLLELDAIQLSPFSRAEDIPNLSVSIPIIQEIIIEPSLTQEEIKELLDSYNGLVQSYLLNFDKNGISWKNILEGQFWSASFLSSLCETFPCIISIDVEAEDLPDMLEKIQPEGLNVIGGEEEKTGFKSFDQLDEIFEALEILV